MLAAKNLQTAEQTFALEALAASASRAGFVEDFPVLFKNGERIEGGVEELASPNCEKIFLDQGLQESFEKFQKAKDFLKPYLKQYFPEHQVRDLIHQAGLPTFPRPKGIPENFRIALSDKGAGMKYVDPYNKDTYVRVMPGKPHSSNPCQKKPYISHVINGQHFDKFGNNVDWNAAAAHIPIDEFIYKSN